MTEEQPTAQDVARAARQEAINEIRRRAKDGGLKQADFEEMGVSWPPLEGWKMTYITKAVMTALEKAGFDPDPNIIPSAKAAKT